MLREVTHRGLASHVDSCPLKKREWQGKPYANVMHDCSHCEHFEYEEVPLKGRKGLYRKYVQVIEVKKDEQGNPIEEVITHIGCNA